MLKQQYYIYIKRSIKKIKVNQEFKNLYSGSKTALENFSITLLSITSNFYYNQCGMGIDSDKVLIHKVNRENQF